MTATEESREDLLRRAEQGFSTTRLRPGYVMKDVDAFLTHIVETLRGTAATPLTPADVRSQGFGTTRLRPGYDEEEIDAFLDEVERFLSRS